MLPVIFPKNIVGEISQIIDFLNWIVQIQDYSYNSVAFTPGFLDTFLVRGEECGVMNIHMTPWRVKNHYWLHFTNKETEERLGHLLEVTQPTNKQTRTRSWTGR